MAIKKKEAFALYERRLCLMFARSDWVFPLKNVRSIYSGAKKNFIRIKFPLFFVNSMKLRAFCWFFHIFFPSTDCIRFSCVLGMICARKHFFGWFIPGEKLFFIRRIHCVFIGPNKPLKSILSSTLTKEKNRRNSLCIWCVCVLRFPFFLSFFHYGYIQILFLLTNFGCSEYCCISLHP